MPPAAQRPNTEVTSTQHHSQIYIYIYTYTHTQLRFKKCFTDLLCLQLHISTPFNSAYSLLWNALWVHNSPFKWPQGQILSACFRDMWSLRSKEKKEKKKKKRKTNPHVVTAADTLKRKRRRNTQKRVSLSIYKKKSVTGLFSIEFVGRRWLQSVGALALQRTRM